MQDVCDQETSNEWDGISEIVREDTGEWEIPMADWELEVLERGLEENVGSIGGREDYVCNARVRVTEPDGSEWTGFVDIDVIDAE